MGKALSSIQEFATVAFTLLGILFGMVIMTFIFGQLGPSTIVQTDDVNSRLNVSGFINASNFTIPEASDSNFTGGFVVVEAFNNSGGELILAGNYTVDAATGSITNATVVVYSDVNLTYTFTSRSQAEQASIEVQNNSLQAIVSYTAQSSTQLSTLAIAITLAILIAVFLLFWFIFVKNQNPNWKKGKDSGGNFS